MSHEKRSIAQLDFEGNPYIGLFSFATDSLCVVGKGIAEKHIDTLREVLGVDVVEATLLEVPLAGILAAGNSKGIIVSDNVEKREIELLKTKTDVLVLGSRHTAIGNLILANVQTHTTRTTHSPASPRGRKRKTRWGRSRVRF